MISKISKLKFGRNFFLGAKLSVSLCCCQIVRCQIFLSWCQIVRLPSWCQIVRFYYLGAELSGAKLSGCQILRCQNVQPPFILLTTFRNAIVRHYPFSIVFFKTFDIFWTRVFPVFDSLGRFEYIYYRITFSLRYVISFEHPFSLFFILLTT